MNKNIFDFDDYKAYLLQKIASLPRRGRGFRLQIAEFIHCQKPFVSQVLKGDSHFSLEQGDRINRLLQHDQEESQYFLFLIEFARAGTESLREFFRLQLASISEKRLLLKNRIKSDGEISEAEKSKYYSSWIYGAIRVATTIPKLRSRTALARTLALPEEILLDALQFLEKSGIIERKGDEYFPASFNLHLGSDSSLIARHHTNWRLRTLDAITREKPSDLHFSGVVSISKKDATRIKSIFVDAIERSQEVVKESPEEELFVVCTDFYGI